VPSVPLGRRLPALALAGCLLGWTGALLALAPAAAATRGWSSGAVTAGGSPAQVRAFASWRGSAATSAGVYDSAGSWAQFIAPGALAQQWSGYPGVVLSIAVPVWPSGVGGSLARAASGAYDGYYRDFAAQLVSHGEAGAVLRFGWEFNGNWYPWRVDSAGTARQFAAAFRCFVATAHTVRGQHFSFDWNFSNGVYGAAAYLALAYPGDAYVTDIGDDVFDWDWNRNGQDTSAQRWADLRTGSGDGLDWQASFAAAHHKRLSFPEWGEARRLSGSESVGGNDDPAFVTDMLGWFGAHATSYENYFDVDYASSSEWHALTDGRFADSSLRYRQLF
jgi:hypothetical protein